MATGNRSCGKPTGFCPCRGVVPGDPSVERPGLDTSTVLQLWSGPAREDWNNSIAQVVRAGYSAIQSQGWYLEDIHLVVNWQKFYAVDPMEGVPLELSNRVLGGEVCMWGEYIDGSALLNVAWPRAAAAAERLWSPRRYSNATEAHPRLARFRCLLEARGIPAGVLDISASSPYTKLQGAGQAGQPPPGPVSRQASHYQI